MKQHFLARMRAALDEIEQNAPADLARFEYVDLLAAQVADFAAPRTLFAAAAEGDVHTTRALLRKPGVDADAVNEDDITAMYIAAAHGHTAVVEVLADEGRADVGKGTRESAKLLLVEAWKENPPDAYGRDLIYDQIPPLYIAAQNGRVGTVQALLQRGAQVDQETRLVLRTKTYAPGKTPLYAASEGGHAESIKLLIAGGGDVNKAISKPYMYTTCMLIASKGGHAEAVEILLSAGATNVCDGEGRTPLHLAAEEGHCEVITLLLDHGGVDIDQVTEVYHSTHPGSTALLLASLTGREETIKVLIKRGADVNKANMEGETPFLIAAENGYSEVVTVLLDHGGGVDINQVTGEEHENPGSTALCLASEGVTVMSSSAAVQEVYMETIKVLLKRGADVHKACSGGWTPVHTASIWGHAEAVHVLLKAGADANAAANDGSTALHCTVDLHIESGHPDTIRVLAEIWPTNPLAWRMFLMGGGAASELQDYLAPPADRTTRNHLPRLYSKPDMMKEVYKYLHKPRYVDMDQLNKQGKTALQLAEAFGESHVEMAALLRGLSLG